MALYFTVENVSRPPPSTDLEMEFSVTHNVSP